MKKLSTALLATTATCLLAADPGDVLSVKRDGTNFNVGIVVKAGAPGGVGGGGPPVENPRITIAKQKRHGDPQKEDVVVECVDPACVYISFDGVNFLFLTCFYTPNTQFHVYRDIPELLLRADKLNASPAPGPN